MNKKGIEFALSWIFAIIAGAAILISAVYITTQLVGTERKISDTLVASELTNLLNPIETNLEDSKYTAIEFTDETRVFNDCSTQGVFGKQQISTASQLGIGDEWGEQSVKINSFNKYLFSGVTEESKQKKMHALVQPLFIPFKVGDVTLLYGGSYCLVNPPSDIEDLITDLSGNGKQDIGLGIATAPSLCARESTTVCFNTLGCDVNVDTQSRAVSTNATTVYYEGTTLALAAILSDHAIYECQLKRFMGRASELAVVYARKAAFIDARGCSNNLAPDLQAYVLAAAINNSHDFIHRIVPYAEDIKEVNDGLANCKIF